MHMGRTRDIAGILALVIGGMFVPFAAAVLLIFPVSMTQLVVGFLVFVVAFGVELGVVIIFFKMSSRRSSSEVERLRPK